MVVDVVSRFKVWGSGSEVHTFGVSSGWVASISVVWLRRRWWWWWVGLCSGWKIVCWLGSSQCKSGLENGSAPKAGCCGYGGVCDGRGVLGRWTSGFDYPIVSAQGRIAGLRRRAADVVVIVLVVVIVVGIVADAAAAPATVSKS